MKLPRRQCICLLSYVLALAAASAIIHEAAHILAALAFGVHPGELRLGFYGINPSVTLPEWLSDTQQGVVHYAGGMAAGMVLLLLYLIYWVRWYRRSPSFYHWFLGLVTVTLAGMQVATGYLEGRYHGAYIMGAGSPFSPTHVLPYAWAVSAIFFHFALCPWRRMKGTPSSMHGSVTHRRQGS